MIRVEVELCPVTTWGSDQHSWSPWKSGLKPCRHLFLGSKVHWNRSQDLFYHPPGHPLGCSCCTDLSLPSLSCRVGELGIPGWLSWRRSLQFRVTDGQDHGWSSGGVGGGWRWSRHGSSVSGQGLRRGEGSSAFPTGVSTQVHSVF